MGLISPPCFAIRGPRSQEAELPRCFCTGRNVHKQGAGHGGRPRRGICRRLLQLALESASPIRGNSNCSLLFLFIDGSRGCTASVCGVCAIILQLLFSFLSFEFCFLMCALARPVSAPGKANKRGSRPLLIDGGIHSSASWRWCQ